MVHADRFDELNTVRYVDSAAGGSGIQQAVDAVGDGGTVKLRGGVFTVSEPVNLDGLTGVTITSDRNDAVVRAADGLDTQIFNNTTNTAVSNITFEGFTIDGNAANQTLADATNFYAIGDLQNATRVTLRQMTIRNATNNAVVLNGDNHRVIECQFEQIGHPDAARTAAAVAIPSGAGHYIAGNQFGRATDNAVFSRNNGAVIVGNHFKEVMIYLADTGTHNQFFVANEIEGAHIEPVSGAVMSRRWFRFQNPDITNVHVTGNILHNVDAPAGNFVEATASTTGLANIHIQNNIIDGGGNVNSGVLWNDTVHNLHITGNLVRDTARDGINVTGAINGSVSNNHIYNTNASNADFVWPLQVNRNNTLATENVTVSGNTVIDDRATTQHYDGLRVHDNTADWITVTDNIVRGARNIERDISTATNHLVVNGLAYNAGDPASTGQWNGEGYEGLTVRDTTNTNTYLYTNGAWSQIAAA